MNVTFMRFSPKLASARYRSQVPQQELAALGVPEGRDVLVASKHFWRWEDATAGYKKVVFDVCTNHFITQFRDFYLDACARADAVVAASAEMARIVKQHTGRAAWVIEDPYEEPERDPYVGPSLLWHGHIRNAREIEAWKPLLTMYELRCVTGGRDEIPDGYLPWSPALMDDEYRRAGMVVLPYLGNPESTANRAINAIRRGRWPVCGPMPALADLGVWQGHIVEGVRWALDNQNEVLNRLYFAQDYVNARYSPKAIGLKWKAMLETL